MIHPACVYPCIAPSAVNSNRRNSHAAVSLVAILVVCILAGCGGGSSSGSGGSGGGSNPISVTITSPAAAPTIQAGQTVSITAAVANDSSNKGVTWSMSGGGTLSGQTATTVTYNAPKSESANATATVTATSATDTTKSASLTITVTPLPPITVSVTNPISTIVAGAAAVTLNATVQNDSSNSGVTWTLTAGGSNCSPICGALSGNTSSSVTYTPPATAPSAPNNAPTITATSVANTAASSADAFTITAPPPPISVTITNPISTIAAGAAAVTVNAAVQNDSSNSGVTWTLTAGGSNCSPTCGDLSGETSTSATYTPPASAPSSPDNSPSITATSVANTTKSASDAFSITASSNSDGLLKGQYAFLVSGFDSALAASITADGKGNITAGEEDIVTPTGTMTGSAIAVQSGTYTVGPDNRGTLSYKDANNNSFTFAFALGQVTGGVAVKGEMIEFDKNPLEMTGVMQQQDPTAFSTSKVTGPYALGFSGWDGTPAPVVEVGSFSLSGSTISNGLSDFNDAGSVQSAQSFTGSLGSIDTNGRVAVTSGSQPSAAYIVNSGLLLYITGGSSGVLSGLVQQQTGGPFSAASLNGVTVFQEQGRTTVPSPKAILGLMTFDGSTATASYSFDVDNGGGVDQPISGSDTYSVTSAVNGRVTLGSSGGGVNLVMYMIAPNTAFIEGAGADTGFGRLEPQAAGPFSNSSVNGSFFFGTLPLVGPPSPQGTDSSVPPVTITSGIVTLNGTNISVTHDLNSSGTLQSGSQTPETYTVGASGRVTFGSGDSMIAYIVGPAKFYFLNFPSGAYGNPFIGVGKQ